MARLSFRCVEGLVERVDVARGREPREAWLRRTVERTLEPQETTCAHDVPAPDEQPEVVYVDPSEPGEVEAARIARERGAKVWAATQGRGHLPTCKCPVCS